MPSLIPTGEIFRLTGAFADHFTTFATNELGVYKDSQQRIIQTNVELYPGYRETSAETNFDNAPVSGSFLCLATWEKSSSEKYASVTEAKIQIPTNMVRIKVEPSVRNFINNGKNQLFTVDGLSYNSIEDEKVQNYLGLKYYIYFLGKTL